MLKKWIPYLLRKSERGPENQPSQHRLKLGTNDGLPARGLEKIGFLRLRQDQI